jgi:hypothetical protein
LHIEADSGRTSTWTVSLPRAERESALSLQTRAVAAYRQRHPIAGRIVSIEVNVGTIGGAA